MCCLEYTVRFHSYLFPVFNTCKYQVNHSAILHGESQVSDNWSFMSPEVHYICSMKSYNNDWSSGYFLAESKY